MPYLFQRFMRIGIKATNRQEISLGAFESQWSFREQRARDVKPAYVS